MKKINKPIILGILITLILLSVCFVFSDIGEDSFTITEKTEYGLTENIIWITISENVGKDQIINITNLFDDNYLTNQIEYTEILLNQSYQKPIYGNVTINLGKYKTLVNNCTVDLKSLEETCISIYYDDSSEIINCDKVLEDKSCLIESYGLIGTEPSYKYLTIPDLKEKVTIDGLKLEMKQEGIPLPKNSIIQLKITYKHPIAILTNKPTEKQNKYDIKVTSNDGEDEAILDPTWFNNSWGRCVDLNVTGGNSALNNFTFFVNVTYNESMQSNFSDIRFVNARCNNGGSEMSYEKDGFLENIYSGFWVRAETLSTGTNQFSMYFNNSIASDGQDIRDAWDKNYTAIYHFSNNATDGQNISNSASSRWAFTTNLTWAGPPNFLLNGAFGNNFYYDGSSSSFYLNSGSDPGFFPDNLTAEVWFRTTSGSDGDWLIGIHQRWDVRINNNQITCDDEWSGTGTMTGGTTAENGSWHYAVCTTSTGGGADGILYYDGSAVDTGLDRGASATQVGFGVGESADSSGAPYTGYIDEVRLSNITRSVDWIDRSYKNRNPTYYTFGTIESYDTFPPSVIINNPTNTSFSGTSMTFNISVTDDSNDISNCSMRLDGSGNITMINSTGTNADWLSTNSTMIEGSHIAYFWCNDTGGNINDSEKVSFRIDNTFPNINITYPENLTSITTSDATYNVSLNYTVSDENLLDDCWFNVTYSGAASGTEISTTILPGCLVQNTSFLVTRIGYNFSITTCANDSANNINCSNVIYGIYVTPGGGTTSPGGGGGGTTIINVTEIHSFCGDLICENGENYYGFLENFWSCPVDCREGYNFDELINGFAYYCFDQNDTTPCFWYEGFGSENRTYICGDGFCDKTEHPFNCNEDCGNINMNTLFENCFDNDLLTPCFWNTSFATYSLFLIAISLFIISVIKFPTKEGNITLQKYVRIKTKRRYKKWSKRR